MKYAHYNEEDGKLLGYYSDDIHHTTVTKLVPKLTDDLQNVVLLETYEEEVKTPLTDDSGEVVLDEDSNVVYDITYVTKNKTAPRYDEDGNEIEYDLDTVVTVEIEENIPNIPEPNIELTDDQHSEALANNYNYVDVESKSMSKKDFRTLEQLISAKVQEIEKSYHAANQENISFMDTEFQANYDSQDLITKTITASGGVLPDGFAWRDATNVDVPMTFDDLQGLANALLIRGQGNWVKYQELKAQANAATTAEELDAIAW